MADTPSTVASQPKRPICSLCFSTGFKSFFYTHGLRRPYNSDNHIHLRMSLNNCLAELKRLHLCIRPSWRATIFDPGASRRIAFSIESARTFKKVDNVISANGYIGRTIEFIIDPIGSHISYGVTPISHYPLQILNPRSRYRNHRIQQQSLFLLLFQPQPRRPLASKF